MFRLKFPVGITDQSLLGKGRAFAVRFPVCDPVVLGHSCLHSQTPPPRPIHSFSVQSCSQGSYCLLPAGGRGQQNVLEGLAISLVASRCGSTLFKLSWDHFPDHHKYKP